MFEKGAKIEVTRAAHPYRHGGLVDPTFIVPEAKLVMTVARVTKTKRGRKVHFQNDDYFVTNFAMYVDEENPLHSFREIK